ncbi:MAG: hypothetical protein FJW37_01760 [Acidobacteria bacterium]|nr:hypothetical protein [Acidobacteriota bacterium]
MSRLLYLRCWPAIARVFTVFAAAALGLAVWLAARFFSGIADVFFRYVIACIAVQSVVLVLLTMVLALGKCLSLRASRARSAHIRLLEDLLADHAAGLVDRGAVLEASNRYAQEFVEVCSRSFELLRGASQRALEELLLDSRAYQELLRDTCSPYPPRALRAISLLSHVGAPEALAAIERAVRNPVALVAMEARIALLRVGPEDVQREILEHLPHLPFWQRVVLLHHLPENSPLLASFVSGALASPDDDRILAALELVLGRQKLLPVENFARLAASANIEVRIRFFKALPFLLGLEWPVEVLRTGLADPDWRVRAMAARACGHMQAAECAPQLRQILVSSVNSIEAGHAARSLAKMGGEAWKSLQTFAWSVSENVRASAPAGQPALRWLAVSALQGRLTGPGGRPTEHAGAAR